MFKLVHGETELVKMTQMALNRIELKFLGQKDIKKAHFSVGKPNRVDIEFQKTQVTLCINHAVRANFKFDW